MSKAPIAPLTRKHVLAVLPPYPIVLVTTRANVITVNQVEYFTFSPLRIGVGIARPRYTYGLLKAEREFVINVPDASLVEAVKRCGAISGRAGDKFEAVGLTPEPSFQVDAVSIRECVAHIECRVEREVEFEERTWFIGPVMAARQAKDHTGMDALLCGRAAYILPGDIVAPR